jgi:hypothetical protein
MRFRALLPVLFLGLVGALPCAAATHQGRLGGVVIAEGTPQLGATVVVTPVARPGDPLKLLTNGRGIFSSTPLLSGFYSVRVRVVGFLPAFESHVRVLDGQITVLRIELGSLFSSVEELRRDPRARRDAQEWAWVLRSASITRPVLRFSEEPTGAEAARQAARAPHGRAELTSGSLSAWSPAETDPLGETSFLYNQDFGKDQLLMAGSLGYQDSASGGVSATWLRPSPNDRNATDSTTIVFQQSQFTSNGPGFRGFEISSQRKVRFSNGAELDYGGQYVVAMFDGTASSARPEVRLKLAPIAGWIASFQLASNPEAQSPDGRDNPLETLQAFPTPLENDGHLVLDHPWHEELGLKHALGSLGTLSAAVYHDSDGHTAIFGRGPLNNYNTIADPFSDSFVYNGGSLNSWGGRVSYQRQISPNWQTAVLYGWARALAPDAAVLSEQTLRQEIIARPRQMLGGRFTGRIERTGTEISSGYEWISGPVLSQPDPFGAELTGIEPYWNVSVRQPLPSFFCCRIVALIDVRNLLAQGYVSLETGDGRAILIPAALAIRGGFAVQF